jgi:hypothetical protein
VQYDNFVEVLRDYLALAYSIGIKSLYALSIICEVIAYHIIILFRALGLSLRGCRTSMPNPKSAC